MNKSTTHNPFSPLMDRVLLAPIPPLEKPSNERRAGNILLPEGSQVRADTDKPDPHVIATVVGIGPDCKGVEVGDKVLVHRGHCTTIKVGDYENTFILFQQIIAKVEG
jgi:co-chaperonin GroES (HSP10)